MAFDTNQTLLKNLLRTRNFLKYTGLTYEEIVTQIVARLRGDPRFDNMKESAIAQMAFEIFAAVGDLVAYTAERRAEESYFASAKNRSSIVALARNLAYDVKRNIPAEASIKVRLKGNITGVTAGDVLEIPIFTSFTYGSSRYLLRRTFRYTFVAGDIGQGSSFSRDITTRAVSSSTEETYISVIQGEKKTARIMGSNNVDQVNQPFQKYRIEDKTFSNIYGSQDFTDQAITKVGVGTSLEEALYSGDDDDLPYGPYEVDRRSLLSIDVINNFDFTTGKTKKVCLVRSALDGNVELKFGDDKYAAKGLTSTDQNVYVEYLSSNGSKGNQTGIIDEKLTINDTVTVGGNDITGNVEFIFTSNLVNGADDEDEESIRNNAPALFYSLDRLVISEDYENYLKSLSTPINVKAAIAWGEQEEIRQLDSALAISKLFNVVLFTCIGSLYNITDNENDTFSPKTSANGLDSAVLDNDFTEDKVTSQSYVNVVAKQNVVEQLKLEDTLSTANEFILINGETLPVTYDEFALWRGYRQAAGSWDSVTMSATYYDISSAAEATVELTASFTGMESFEDVAIIIAAALTSCGASLDSVSCVYDSSRNRFVVSCLKTGFDYFTNIVDELDYSNSSAYSFLLSTSAASYDTVAYNNSIAYSRKIDTVTSLLRKRSQLTVKPIYVSPIIHNMQLMGNIYVQPLADKEDLHRQIKNKIYLWANENVTFNTPIDLSTIVGLIEEFPDVQRADVKLWPTTLMPTGDNVAFFDINTDPRSMSVAYRDIFRTAILSFYSVMSGSVVTETSAVSAVFSQSEPYFWTQTATWLKPITEREFLTTLVANIISNLPDSATQDPEFYSIVSDIHKDFSWIIRYNLLDSYGNIRPEYTEQSVNGVTTKAHVRGGYSLGTEIVKLQMNTTALYNS